MSQTMTRRGFNGTVVGGSLLLALDACGGKKEQPTNSSKPADKVTFLTGFGTTPREDYAFVGKAAGCFSTEGIDIAISAGQPSDGNLKTLAAKGAHFAAIDYVSAARGKSNEAYDYMIAGAVQGTTLLSMITLPSKKINVPSDLMGKTVGTAAAAATMTLFPTYARLAGFDPSKVKFLPFPSDQLPGLLASGQIDAMGAYAIDTPGISTAAHGAEPVVFEYSKWITDLYGTVIVARGDIIHSNPDLVSRFMRAMWASVKYAVGHPEDAGTFTHAAVPAVDAKTMAATMGLMRPYVTVPTLDAAKVMRGIALLEQANLAPKGLQPEQLVDFSFAPKAA